MAIRGESLQRISADKIQFRMAFIFGLIETIALFFIALLDIDTKTNMNLIQKFFGGIIVGIITMFGLLLFVNLILSKIKISFKSQRIEKINYTIPCILDGIFLALLFTIESVISPLKKIDIIFGNALVAFIIILIVIPVTLALYNYSDFSKKTRITFFMEKKKFFVKKINILGITIFGAIYEVIALPIMAYLGNKQFLYSYIGDKFGFALIGFIAGFAASFATIFIYNRFFKKSIYLDIVS